MVRYLPSIIFKLSQVTYRISPGCRCNVAGQGSRALTGGMAKLCCPRFIWIPFGQILDDESDWIIRFFDKQPLDDLDEKAAMKQRRSQKYTPSDNRGHGQVGLSIHDILVYIRERMLCVSS